MGSFTAPHLPGFLLAFEWVETLIKYLTEEALTRSHLTEKALTRYPTEKALTSTRPPTRQLLSRKQKQG